MLILQETREEVTKIFGGHYKTADDRIFSGYTRTIPKPMKGHPSAVVAVTWIS